jgi:hypothetical protein
LTLPVFFRRLFIKGALKACGGYFLVLADFLALFSFFICMGKGKAGSRFSYKETFFLGAFVGMAG